MTITLFLLQILIIHFMKSVFYYWDAVNGVIFSSLFIVNETTILELSRKEKLQNKKLYNMGGNNERRV